MAHRTKLPAGRRLRLSRHIKATILAPLNAAIRAARSPEAKAALRRARALAASAHKVEVDD
jgi:hypothetical protein